MCWHFVIHRRLTVLSESSPVKSLALVPGKENVSVTYAIKYHLNWKSSQRFPFVAFFTLNHHRGRWIRKRILLFREKLSEKMCTRQSRKVIWDVINTLRYSWHCSCRIFYCCFPLAFANIRLWPLVPFFQISLNNSELKTARPQYLSGLSRALFPTTFLEIAVMWSSLVDRCKY